MEFVRHPIGWLASSRRDASGVRWEQQIQSGPQRVLPRLLAPCGAAPPRRAGGARAARHALHGGVEDARRLCRVLLAIFLLGLGSALADHLRSKFVAHPDGLGVLHREPARRRHWIPGAHASLRNSSSVVAVDLSGPHRRLGLARAGRPTHRAHLARIGCVVLPLHGLRLVGRLECRHSNLCRGRHQASSPREGDPEDEGREPPLQAPGLGQFRIHILRGDCRPPGVPRGPVVLPVNRRGHRPGPQSLQPPGRRRQWYHRVPGVPQRLCPPPGTRQGLRPGACHA
mmetsp:Transcript_5656/g.21404  ORF Transcript_5656/g.21404 Transcript_5656/m.21404 type:complete len:285 (-) Transcript_5656:495-1349(-)